ncbi:L-threonylcarbamoyladenylate synthase [Ureaplasma urealyticum]|uniref:L-threonylcarbamoyladenylate synthase n=2 Tax=Ureaplasma urealyticum TaxID=2130 RepID=A0AAP9AC01_UREUR|nr:L-threonylcarbamoyladenylate synthase [Ureaplasma urealyticum]EDU06455.1 conserved hypothetical protein [Ureaplasma urealyticum serovar 5 str. ATCC 27817]EDU56788.1 conserved hypothetical protein [Ureaplasma urealyticum serovar 7 str. ATCC 27819]EDU67246.1 conserved hypothetical protein [Ureaplasma urealyticum serovar 11 str. ATCC 33695]EEH01447.1 conserved hypothetical protein [Ureaplasma urealyticum serovar 8 str. ATCC 27618]MCF1348687.1 L-threonylcarbamoyladenylate synthase [Ureaplasma u
MKIYRITNLNAIYDALVANKCVLIPTDTIIGLLAKNQDVIYEIKRRDRNKKIVRFVADYKLLGDLTVEQEQFLDLFWPGSVTVIKNGVSYRMPNSPHILKLIQKLGPLYCSSANISGEEPVKNHNEAIFKFGANSKLIYVEAQQQIGVPSTIVDIDKWEYVRRGANIEMVDMFIKELKYNNTKEKE